MRKLEELASFEKQVEQVQLQDRLCKENIQENYDKVFEPVTDTIEDTSRDITKTMTEISIKNDKVLENLNHKFLEIINEGGILKFCFCLLYLKSLILNILVNIN